MDPSQKAAKPLSEVKPGDLLRQMAQHEADPESSPEFQENRARAGAEISMIFELKESTAFQWFMREFVDKPYSQAFELLRNPNAPSWKDEGKVTLEEVQAVYVALKEVKTGMLEREIAHREQIDPNDAEIKRLRAELARL